MHSYSCQHVASFLLAAELQLSNLGCNQQMLSLSNSTLKNVHGEGGLQVLTSLHGWPWLGRTLLKLP